MRIYTTNGVTTIDQDELLLAKIEGENLSGIDISDLRIDADTLSKQYLMAESIPETVVRDPAGNVIEVKKYHEVKRYAVLKAAYLDKVKKAEEQVNERSR
jgi:hypothetical protein